MAKIVQLDNKTAADTAAEKIQSQNFAENDEEDAEEYERYIPVEQSIIESLKQIREMRAGRLPEQTWDDFLDELRATVAEVETEEQVKKSVAKKNYINRTLQG